MKRFLTLAMALVMVLGAVVPAVTPKAEAAAADAVQPISWVSPSYQQDGSITEAEWGTAPMLTQTISGFGTLDYYFRVDESQFYIAVSMDTDLEEFAGWFNVFGQASSKVGTLEPKLGGTIVGHSCTAAYGYNSTSDRWMIESAFDLTKFADANGVIRVWFNNQYSLDGSSFSAYTATDSVYYGIFLPKVSDSYQEDGNITAAEWGEPMVTKNFDDFGTIDYWYRYDENKIYVAIQAETQVFEGYRTCITFRSGVNSSLGNIVVEKDGAHSVASGTGAYTRNGTKVMYECSYPISRFSSSGFVSGGAIKVRVDYEYTKDTVWTAVRQDYIFLQFPEKLDITAKSRIIYEEDGTRVMEISNIGQGKYYFPQYRIGTTGEWQALTIESGNIAHVDIPAGMVTVQVRYDGNGLTSLPSDPMTFTVYQSLMHANYNYAPLSVAPLAGASIAFDGVMSAGEWDGAPDIVKISEDGDTMACWLCYDDTNLYVAVRVDTENYDETSSFLSFYQIKTAEKHPYLGSINATNKLSKGESGFTRTKTGTVNVIVYEFSYPLKDFSPELSTAGHTAAIQLLYETPGLKLYSSDTADRVNELVLAYRTAEMPEVTLTVNGENGTLNGTAADYLYSTDGGFTWMPCTADTTALTNLTAGDIFVKNPGNGTSIAPAVQTVSVNKVAGVPAVQGVNESALDVGDGKITGLTTAMEWKKSTDAAYTPFADADGDGILKNLTPGTYYVRFAATADALASADATVIIRSGNAIPTSAVLDPAVAPKTTYEVGEALDVAGLKLIVRMNDGTTKTVPVTPAMVTGFDSSDIYMTQTLTVTYTENGASASDTYDVKIVREILSTDETNFMNALWMMYFVYNQKYEISAAATDGGTITPAGITKVKYGTDFTYTITPDEGYAIQSVIVDGTDVGAVSEYTFTKVKGGHTISAVFKKTEVKIDFDDLDADAWYYEDVLYVVKAGLMNGTGEGFDAEGDLNRAALVTVLWRYAGEPKAKSSADFSDVKPGEWYTDAVNWAAETGVVTGADGEFAPEDAITREETMAVFHRFADYMKYETKAADDGGHTTSDWAKNDVAWANANGLIPAAAAAGKDTVAPASGNIAVDGKISESEWGAPDQVIDDYAKVEFWWRYDAENLYVAARVDTKTYVNGNSFYTLRGGLTADTVTHKFDLYRNAEGEFLSSNTTSVKDSSIFVREGNVSVYESRIPWTKIFPTAPKTGDTFIARAEYLDQIGGTGILYSTGDKAVLHEFMLAEAAAGPADGSDMTKTATRGEIAAYLARFCREIAK